MRGNLIAVTSMAARCAGAEDVDDFWRLLETGAPQFRPVPEGRWAERATDRFPGRDNRSYSHVMAPLRDPFAFDAQRFRIPKARSRRMDPQQRLAIGLVDELFSRSGGQPDAGAGPIATVLGVSSTDYRSISAAPLIAQLTVDGTLGSGAAEEVETIIRAAERAVLPMSGHSMSGVLANMVPAAVQSTFDLTGPAFSVDSACASGLTAVDMACALLLLGRVRACIAGGVYTALTPEAHVGFSAIGALSRSGRCRPYTSSADGFVIGEGGALLMLKLLEDAVADGDTVLGVIAASGSSNDGRGQGVMTPTVGGQIRAIEDAVRASDPRILEVDAIEGHGTGTTVGDKTELETLRRVYGQHAGAPIPLGSVKSIVGHTMAASGALALAKAVLALSRGSWPGQPVADVADASPVLRELPFTLEAAPRPERLRRVAVNSFGFGGTNCHIVLESAEEALAHA